MRKGTANSRMYEGVATWNPFKGCHFQCSYCKPSFQAQAKRQKHNCKRCYSYEPHVHPERMTRIPSARTIFACANGDVAFCEKNALQDILHVAGKNADRVFYFQTKKPSCLYDLYIPDNVIVGTTLETDYDRGYGTYVSEIAPPPSERYEAFYNLKHYAKFVTVEPIMEFSPDFVFSLIELKPFFVYIGYNSRPKQVKLPEPRLADTMELIETLCNSGIEVRTKLLRERIE